MTRRIYNPPTALPSRLSATGGRLACGTLAPLRRWLMVACALAGLSAAAWPTTDQWIPVTRGGVYLQDSNTDTNGSRNVVSDATHAAAYIFNDGTYFYFRTRLDTDPTGQGGQGLLQPYGWGMELDTNLQAPNYEWLIMVDGIARDETIGLWQNTVQGTVNDPGDKAELLYASLPLSGNFQVVTADTAFGGSTDYFLDWRFPYATFKAATGLTDSSPVRIFAGSSSSANALTENGADLVGASDLVTGFSDFITPFGVRPTTGTVRYVQNLSGTGDVTLVSAGETLYIRVDDLDQDTNPTAANTVQVTLVTTHGDSETLTLTETGIHTGVFTGSIVTSNAAVAINSGTIQLSAVDTVTVTYVDAIDVNLLLNRPRTDTVTTRSPDIRLTKAATATVTPGQEIIYTISYRNAGAHAANTLVIADSVPAPTAYVGGSLRIGSASSTYDSATDKTDAADADGATYDAGTGSISFTVSTVAADDGATGSGSDEGKVYFKVLVP